MCNELMKTLSLMNKSRLTNLVPDEDDGVDMKDGLDLRHEGMSKRNVNMSAVLTSVNRKGDNLVTI